MELALASGCRTGPPSYKVHRLAGRYDSPTPEPAPSPSNGLIIRLWGLRHLSLQKSCKTEALVWPLMLYFLQFYQKIWLCTLCVRFSDRSTPFFRLWRKDVLQERRKIQMVQAGHDSGLVKMTDHGGHEPGPSLRNLATLVYKNMMMENGFTTPQWHSKLVNFSWEPWIWKHFAIAVQTVKYKNTVLKPNSWTYNFVEASGHNLESSPTWGFCIKCLHYKPVLNHFC